MNVYMHRKVTKGRYAQMLTLAISGWWNNG